MSILVRKKVIKECDGSGCCGGDVGACINPVPLANAATNINGMGNPVPPSENSLGSGDNFGNVITNVATQAAVPQSKYRYKVRRKKKQ